MHRSGTSMVARVLHESGLYLGEEKDLAPPKPDNADGFWENLKLVDLNEEILGELGGGWDLPPGFPEGWQSDEEFQKLIAKAEITVGAFRGREPWGWKDPRNSITLPFWREVLPSLRVVICVRNPLEVASSLRQRNFFSYEMALSLWAAYNRRVVEASRSGGRLVVHYDAFFQRPEAELRRLLHFAGITPDPARIAKAIERVRPELRHNAFDTRHLLDVSLSDETIRLYLELSTEAGWLNGARDLARSYASAPETTRLLREGAGSSELSGKPERRRVSPGKLNRNALDLELLRREIGPAREEMERQGVQIAALQAQIEPAKEEIERRGSRIVELESQLQPAREELQLRAVRISELEADLLPVREEVQQRGDRIRELESQLGPAREELQLQFTRIENLESQLQRLAKEGRRSEESDHSRDQISEQLNVSTAAVKRLQASILSLETEMKATEEEAQRLQRLLEEKEQALAEAVGKSVQLADENDRNLRKLINVERQRDFYRQATASAQRESQALIEQLGSIHRSRLWKAGASYWKLLQWLGRLPPGQPMPASYSWIMDAPRTVESADSPAATSTKDSSPAGAAEPVPRPAPEIRSIAEGGVKSFVRKLRADKPPEKVVVVAMERFVEEFERRFDRRPSILDWGTGSDLAAALPQDVVFSPAIDEAMLPYIDKSVDAVFLNSASEHAENEARRVARSAVVTTPPSRRMVRGQDEEFPLVVEWLDSDEIKPLCASIIIPVFNQIATTEACLDAVEATLSEHFCGEIIIVDDASTDDTRSRLQRRVEKNSRLRVITNEQNLGFIDSCNRGAAEAVHDFLVFLNNDTLPRGRWLSSLLTTFHRHKGLGAAGGKLLFPDGSLQEAGGRIFSDGSGLNFGKWDTEPAAPLYNFVREVDYCSGALLATPRSLFGEIGGFDTRFRPAYYEDVDYCFEVRKRDLRVVYQPESAVIHLEGATAGTDLGSGAKKYQVVNREKFVNKWQAELASHPKPLQELDYGGLHRLAWPDQLPRALFINHTVPEYDREGGSRRLFHLIEFLREEGWGVTFMAPWVPWGERYERELQQMGVATYRKGLLKLRSGEYETEAERLIATGGFDVAVISFWHIAETWAPLIRRLSPRTRIVIDSIDLHFLRQARATLRAPEGASAQLSETYADEMRRELNAYASSDAVLTVSEKEAGIINDFASNPRLAFAVPETEAGIEETLPFEERRGVLFIGSFRHPPNLEAVTWLAREILPLVDPQLLDEHPVYIVGNGFDEKVAEICAGVRNVRMVGWVPSLDLYLRKARLSVLPLLNGAGTKTKLIQALTAGTPSVSTRIGAEGLPIQDGEHVLIADQPEDFARAIERLLTDGDLWRRLAVNGKNKIEQTHGRAEGKSRLLGVLDHLVRGADVP